MTDRIEVQRTIPAPPADIFAVLCDPQGHVAIDASGMLQDADGEPVTAVGDSFVVHMDRESLNDFPLGKYDVTVTITRLREGPADRLDDPRPDQAADRPRLRLPARADGDGGTLVTSFYDWSDIDQHWRDAEIFPVISEARPAGAPSASSTARCAAAIPAARSRQLRVDAPRVVNLRLTHDRTHAAGSPTPSASTTSSPPSRRSTTSRSTSSPTPCSPPRHLGEVADHLIGHFVDQARRSGASWTEIGKCMGVTKQAAQKRFVPKGRADPRSTPTQGFSRFTPRARNVVVEAQNKAHAAGNDRDRARAPAARPVRPTPRPRAELLAGQGVDADAVADAVTLPPARRRDARADPLQRTGQEGPRTHVPRGTSPGPQLHRHRTHPARPAGERGRRGDRCTTSASTSSASRPNSSTRCAPSPARRGMKRAPRPYNTV